MSIDKYTHRISSATEDGTQMLCEKNGICYWTQDEPGKAFTLDRATTLVKEHTQMMAGPDDEQTLFSVRIIAKRSVPLVTRLARQAYREESRRLSDLEWARFTD